MHPWTRGAPEASFCNQRPGGRLHAAGPWLTRGAPARRAAGSSRDIAWRDVRVGQVLRVQDDELFPADLLCLHSALPDKACFIKTTNLDGASQQTLHPNPTLLATRQTGCGRPGCRGAGRGGHASPAPACHALGRPNLAPPCRRQAVRPAGGRTQGARMCRRVQPQGAQAGGPARGRAGGGGRGDAPARHADLRAAQRPLAHLPRARHHRGRGRPPCALP